MSNSITNNQQSSPSFFEGVNQFIDEIKTSVENAVAEIFENKSSEKIVICEPQQQIEIQKKSFSIQNLEGDNIFVYEIFESIFISLDDSCIENVILVCKGWARDTFKIVKARVTIYLQQFIK